MDICGSFMLMGHCEPASGVEWMIDGLSLRIAGPAKAAWQERRP